MRTTRIESAENSLAGSINLSLSCVLCGAPSPVKGRIFKGFCVCSDCVGYVKGLTLDTLERPSYSKRKLS